jgi:tyrosine-specific transport protein
MAGLFPVILLVLVLFGILPAAMSWSESYSNPSSSMKLAQLVPGGRLTLSLIIWRGGCVVFSEILENFGHP